MIGALGVGLGAARAAARAYPRHTLLAAVVAGLLGAPVPELVVAVAAAAALLLRGPSLALAGVAAALAGAVVAQSRVQELDRTALGPLLGHRVALRAHLLERPRTAASGSRRALGAIAGGRGAGERLLLRLSRRSRAPRVEPGEEVTLRGKLVGLGPQDGYLRRRGAHAQLIVASIARTGRRRGGLAGALDRLRAGAERAVSRGLDRPRSALARGMVLGQDEALSDEDRQAFRDSGLAHLLAASGQNVLLLVAVALPLLAAAGFGLRGRLAGALALIALYVPLAGAGPSIQRAGVMGAAGTVAALVGRPASRWYALLLAAAVTLMASPRAAQDPGWQLSFAAVIAIATTAGGLQAALVTRGLPRVLAEAMAVSAAATVGTAPLLVAHFERLSLASLPANVLAAPAVAPVMWLGMAAVLMGPLLPAAAELINAVGALPLAYLGWLAHAWARLPAATLDLSGLSWAGTAAVYAGLAGAAAAWVRWPRVRRPLVALGIAGIAAMALLSRPPPPPDPRTLVVSFFDRRPGRRHAGPARRRLPPVRHGSARGPAPVTAARGGRAAARSGGGHPRPGRP